MNKNYHNPDCVNKKDIPDGRRLMTRKELERRQEITSKSPDNCYDPEIQKWDEVRKQWIIGKYGFAGDSDFFTYCVPNDWKA